jgi:hypothetical protein
MYHFVEFMRISKNPGKLPLSRYLKNSSGSCRGGLGNKNVIGVRFLTHGEQSKKGKKGTVVRAFQKRGSPAW